MSFENIVGKGERDCQPFLPFPSGLLPFERRICETPMPKKQPLLEKSDLDIWPWPWQTILTLVLADAYQWDLPSYQL